MSGTKAGWSPERRAAQAERMRAHNADAQFVKKKNTALASSGKARAARVANMQKVNSDPAIQAKCKAWRESDEGRAAASRGGRAAIELRRTDPVVKLRHQVATLKGNRSPAKRAAASRQLKAMWSDIEFVGRQTLRAKLIAGDPHTMRRAWETRRAGKVPGGYRRRYSELRDRIGAQAAMAVVQREAKMARVNG